jgi:hypothetical protein
VEVTDVTIVLNEELEARLRAEAARRGTDPESLALQAIEETAPADPGRRVLWNGMTVQEWVQTSREWIHGHQPWPDVPDEALTREGLYGDHL